MPTIPYGSHFSVAGEIVHREALPEDAVLTVKLLDRDGNLLRWVRQEQKNNPNLYIDHPQLTCYAKPLDPKREGMKKFGFPELMVRDAANPEASMRNATVKCWYSDDRFKAIIVSATDEAHGAICNDGVGLTDENGAPYTVLERGKYRMVAELSTKDGVLLATVE